tara:strand:- start:1443 stop:2489 length:1047 start_codon:yes stop_codon:yes gene_type:complete
MLISIIIPIRNEAKKIKSAINSCLNQKNINIKKIEIIIADGSSTDGTSEILKLLSEENKCIKIVFNKDKYMPHGFNKALTIATGKYIMVMSGHSVLKNDYIFNSLKAMMENDAQCVSGSMDTIQENYLGKIIGISQSTIFGVGNSTFRINKDKGKYVDTGVFGFYKSKVFLQIGGMDEELIKNQDDEFNFRLTQNGGKIWFDPSIKSKYFSRNTLIKLFKQYFFYGFYKVRVFQKRGGLASIRQLIPPIFILSLLLTIVIKIITNNSIYFISIFGLYVCIGFVFSLVSIKNKKENYLSIPILQYSYLILHSSYGLGFIIGALYFIRKWNKISTLDYNFNKAYFEKNNS